MQRLLPSPAGPTTVAEAYDTPLGSHSDRPWVGLMMVASLDGSTVVDGKSAGLSSETDTAVLLQLRSVADVIIVGAGTVRGEGYGPPEKAGQRIGVVTASGSVDTSTELFASGAGFIITTEASDIAAPGIDVIRAGDDTVDLAAAIRMIPTVCDGATFVQAEGGSTLNGALADANVLDELNLTYSAGTVGGSGPRLVSGAGDHRHPYELAQLAVDEQSFLYTRWRRSAVD